MSAWACPVLLMLSFLLKCQAAVNASKWVLDSVSVFLFVYIFYLFIVLVFTRLPGTELFCQLLSLTCVSLYALFGTTVRRHWREMVSATHQWSVSRLLTPRVQFCEDNNTSTEEYIA